MTRSLTFSEAVWPNKSRTTDTSKWLIRNITLAVIFSAINGLLAHIQFKTAGMPVPITGQTLGVLLTGALLGPRLGVATILLYIAEGYAGLPVFASAANIDSLGYLVGFIPAAWLVGTLAEREWDRKPLTTALMMAAGSVCIYAPGLIWLSRYVHDPKMWILYGFIYFLPGDVIKASIAAALIPTGWRLVGNRPDSNAT